MDSLNYDSYNYIPYEVRCSKYHIKTSDIDVEISIIVSYVVYQCLWDYSLLNVKSMWYVVVGRYAYITTFTSKYTGW